LIATVAGNGTTNYSEDGGMAISSSLDEPYGVAADAYGNMFIAVYTNANAGPSGQWHFTDTNTANYRVRFYRASTP